MQRLGFFVVAVLAVACTAGNGSAFRGGNGDGGDAGSGGSGAAGGSDGGFESVGGGSQGGADPNEIAEVWGHGPDVLYKLDPVTKEVTVVGPFQGCGSVIDIAVDKDNNIYGTTSGNLYRIDGTTAACTLIGSGSYPNSLSFVPEGTLDPTKETLVGYFDATYVRIDTQTGNVQTVGAINGGLASSGDIVSVKNGGTYLTVGGTSCGDCLVQIDPVTGDLITNFGSVGYGSVFGLAFWGGSAYGFSNAGDLFEISFGSSSVMSTPINIPGAPSDLQFWGAGSSTHVPLVPPQ